MLTKVFNEDIIKMKKENKVKIYFSILICNTLIHMLNRGVEMGTYTCYNTLTGESAELLAQIKEITKSWGLFTYCSMCFLFVCLFFHCLIKILQNFSDLMYVYRWKH